MVLVSVVWINRSIALDALACKKRGKALTFINNRPFGAFTVRQQGDVPCLICDQDRYFFVQDAPMYRGPTGRIAIGDPMCRRANYLCKQRELSAAINTFTESRKRFLIGRPRPEFARCPTQIWKGGGA